MNPHQGDVWEASFPYTDSGRITKRTPGKTYVSFWGDIRPIVIVSNNNFNTSDYVLACQMTKQVKKIARYGHLKKHAILIKDQTEMSVAGLDYPSVILPFKLFSLHKNQLKHKRGMLFDDTTTKILNEITKFL